MPGHGDADGFQVVDRHRSPGDDHRAVAVAHAAPARQQGVLVEQEGVGVDADGGHFEFAAQRSAVERLDVLQLVLERETARVDLVVGQGMEHEGVVGIGTVADGNNLLAHEDAHSAQDSVRAHGRRPVGTATVSFYAAGCSAAHRRAPITANPLDEQPMHLFA